PPPARQYADFCIVEQAQWREPNHDAALAYWREELKPENLLETILTYDGIKQSNPGVGASIPLVLNTLPSRELKQLGDEQRATPFMVFLAAFVVLLHKYTHAADVSIGCPVADRTFPGTENLLGAFINT